MIALKKIISWFSLNRSRNNYMLVANSSLSTKIVSWKNHFRTFRRSENPRIECDKRI